MKFRYTNLLWTMLLGCIAVAHPAFAQTRLGLHVTQEELNIWRQRRTDNVNGINGYSFQSIYQNRILADANSFKAQSHPGGDGLWAGYTGSGCIPNNGSVRPGSGGTPYGRGAGAWMARSAFVFLLTGDTSYANPVRTELLSQISQPGTDWTNTSKWCNLSGTNTLETVPWILRLLLAYDYLQAGGYTGFSATEQTNINQWFLNAAQMWDAAHRNGVANSPYPGVYSTPQNLTCSGSACTQLGGILYFGGPTPRSATYNYWDNQGSLIPMLSTAIGVKLNNATQIANGKAWITAMLKVGVWDNGALADYKRWSDCSPGCPGSMWGHVGGQYGAVTIAMDMLARNGDTSLYDYSGATQVIGGGGGIVGWQTSLNLWAQMANHTVLLYGTTSSGDLTTARLLTWDDPAATNGMYYDFSSMAANLYYRNSTITTAMTRNLLGSNSNLNGCYDSQMGGCFSGVWGFWPDLPFMYGNLEGKVNPYGGSSAASISLTVSPLSITSGQSSTLSWFSSNVTACSASGGWSGSKATSGTQTMSPTETTTYTLTCTGSGGSASASANLTVLSPLTEVRIDSGGPGYTGTDGTYEADRYASGENTYSTTASIANTPDPTLYQTVQYGDFTYEIPMANGTYNVTLKFAEVSRPGVGQRVFNVNINGTPVLSNFDIVAQAGSGFRAIDRTFPVTVSNGMLSIAFSSVVDNAMVNAIVVKPYGTVLSPPSDLRLISAQ